MEIKSLIERLKSRFLKFVSLNFLSAKESEYQWPIDIHDFERLKPWLTMSETEYIYNYKGQAESFMHLCGRFFKLLHKTYRRDSFFCSEPLEYEWEGETGYMVAMFYPTGVFERFASVNLSDTLGNEFPIISPNLEECLIALETICGALSLSREKSFSAAAQKDFNVVVLAVGPKPQKDIIYTPDMESTLTTYPQYSHLRNDLLTRIANLPPTYLES